MSEHTPGPWEVMPKVTETIGGQEVIPIYGPLPGCRTKRRIVGTASFHDLEAESNARLIAAAPETAAERDRLEQVNAELLVGLKAAVAQLNHSVPSECWATGPLTGDPYEDVVVCPGCRFLGAARAIIAKAEGKHDESAIPTVYPAARP